MKKKKPKFRRQNLFRFKRIKKGWRAPKGTQSKLRKGKKGKGFLPHPGYGSPKSIKGLHPSGLEEVLIYNPGELLKLSQKNCARIAAKVGKKKRAEIIKKAKELKIKILNPIKKEKK